MDHPTPAQLAIRLRRYAMDLDRATAADLELAARTMERWGVTDLDKAPDDDRPTEGGGWVEPLTIDLTGPVVDAVMHAGGSASRGKVHLATALRELATYPLPQTAVAALWAAAAGLGLDVFTVLGDSPLEAD